MTASLDMAILIGVFTGAAAVVDFRQHRIPNYLTVPAAIIGLFYHSLMPSGIGMGMSLAGFVVGFCLLLMPWILGGGGMGDVKLLAALGTWLGPLWILIAFAASTVCAAFLAMSVMTDSVFTSGVTETKKKFINQSQTSKKKQPKRPRRVIPFAIPVALSTWMLLVWFVAKQSLIS